MRLVRAQLIPSLLLLAASLPSTMAQTSTAQVSGTVMDDSGAAIPLVSVTITSLSTGVSATARSNESGIYRVLYLQPGRYRLEAEAQGFRKFVQEAITLQVADRASIDVKLQLGAVTESVTVSEGARLIETETPEFSQLVDQRAIQELPLDKREAMQLVLLAPGFTADRTFVTGSSGDSSPNYFATRWRVGGSRPMANEVLVDGVTNTGADKSFMQYNPPVDVTQEFKIQANAFSAEYGRTSGPVISIITKSGTNEMHGTLYYFHRNSALDANDFFANAAGRPRAVFRRNLYGVAGGGPVVKNKLFFFGDFDGQRLSAPNTRLSTVPTALQKQGDFTRTLDPTGRMIQIYDPLTTTTGAIPSRQPFAGNLIPKERVDPVAAKALGYYPDPNAVADPRTGTNNYVSQVPRSQDWNRFGSRLDYYMADSSRLYGRYAQQKSSQYLPGPWPGVAGGNRHVDDWYRNVTLNYSKTFSPTLTGEIRAGYAGSGAFWGNDDAGFDQTTLGLPAGVKQVVRAFFPVFAPSDVSALGGASFLDYARHTYSVQGLVSRAARGHFLKAGADLRWLQHSPERNTAPSGIYNFSRLLTRGPDPLRSTSDAGHGFASFLLGTGADGRVDHASPPALQVRYTAFFLQDDWKVTPRLTLNLGLRYAFEQGISERYNRLASLELGVPSPLGTIGGKQLMGEVLFRDDKQRNLYDTDWNNFEPRFGFAYQILPGTVVRGGYGIFFMPRQIVDWGGQVGLTTTSNWVASLDNGLTPKYLLSNPYPQGFNLPSNQRDPLVNTGTDVQGFFTHEPIGYMQQWDLSIQRQLRRDMAVEVIYWGSKGTKLQWPSWQMNQLPNQYMSLGNALNQQVPNPFYGIIKTGLLAQPTVARRQTLLPYPQYASLMRTYAMAACSIYHGFTLKVEKRATKGLGFTASYTAGKMIDDSSGQEAWLAGPSSAINDMENRRNERSVSAFDVPQRVVAGMVYDLPFGKGRPLANHLPAVVNAVVGGWTFGMLSQFQSGLPVNLVRTAVSLGRSAKLDNPTIDRWFDTSAFRPAEPFTYGTVGRFLPDVRTDGLTNFDLSALKNFRYRERYRAQFRAEFINALNTAQFGYPNGGVAGLTFGRVSSQYNFPRQVQVALKLFW